MISWIVMRIGRKLKAATKTVLSIVKGRSIANLPESLISRADIISFDVFDTLVIRSVKTPSDVFDLVESAYNTESSAKAISGYKSIRMNAEQKARRESVYNEITLEEIFNNLNDIYGVEVCNRLKEIELKTELEVCHTNDEMAAFYRRMKDEGKRIVIVSDMYLSGEEIGRILEKCGFADYERLYVSSDYRKTKRDGSLFDQVITDCCVTDVSRILHIGDHPRSDYSVPKNKGLKAFLYRKTGVNS